MKKSFLMLIILIISATLSAESGLEFHGNLYSDLGYFHYTESGKSDSLKFGGKSTLSLKFQNVNQRFAKVAAEFDLTIPYGAFGEKYIGSFSDTTALDSIVNTKLSNQIPLFPDLRKLYFSLYFPAFDITVGRQIINFGKGRIFSPLNVFSSVDLSDLNYRRTGSDILNMKIPLSLLSGVDIITEFPFPGKENHAALKIFHNLFNFDLSSLIIYNQQTYKTTAGFTFKGDALVGIYGEFAENFHKNFENRDFEMMLGSDYSIDNKYFWSLEYLYKNKNADTSNLWTRNNFYTSFLYKFNDLINLSANLIYCPDQDGNDPMIFTGQFYYNILQNVDLIFYTRYYHVTKWGNVMPDLEYSTRVNVKF